LASVTIITSNMEPPSHTGLFAGMTLPTCNTICATPLITLQTFLNQTQAS